ncbi:helix-turn-helix domain-containing protein [Streptomyces sp. NPDC058424]|uniref:helix-turn-helix domain-containing protein n=1 Tax=Streptomyces sp. NPDC058424 TaxID=3346491 RepID=UPI0036517E32
MLEGIGIGPLEEQVYVALVAAPAADAGELADRTGLPEPEVERALAELESKSLVTVLPGRRRGLRAAPPTITLHLMALQRIDDARKAQIAIAELAQRYHSAGQTGGSAELMEVIEGGAAIAKRYAQIQRDAREEICALTAGPVVAVSPAANTGQRDALSAGVRYRVVYQRDALEQDHPDNSLLLDQWAELGEEMRVAVDVPLKVVVADNRIALVVPREHPLDEPMMLVTRSRVLVDAFSWIFNRVWESAVPVSAALARAPRDLLTAEDRHLLSLLLAGYTDQAIASQLGLSERTIQRRVHRLLALAGAQTRIQLGWQAACRGWI